MRNIPNLNYPPRYLLACWGPPPPPGGNGVSLEIRAECKQARRKEKKRKEKRKNRKEKSLHKALEREDYSEVIHMGASREARGLE